MTAPFASPLEALAGLLEERARYEAWLNRLDAHRANAPNHVIERVRNDYAERLNGVLGQLRGRASELDASAAAMAERIAALLAEETARRDERAEAELRALVGEFADDYARDLLARCDEAITRLSGERSSVGAELAKVQDILNLVRRPPEIAAPPASPVAPTAPAPAPAAVNATPHGAATTPDSGFDELAFLNSVVQPGTANATAAAERHEFPGSWNPARPQAPSHTQAPQNAPMRASTVPSGELPAFLKDVPTEQARTLKCQECGTMNYATEWYCERCGGELAAM